MMTLRFSIKRTLLGRPGENTGRYLVGCAGISVVLCGVSYLYLPEGWWSSAGPTIGLLVITAFVAVVAGYKRYGVLPGVIGTSLPIFALLLRGAYVASTLELPASSPPTTVEYVSRSVVLAAAVGVPIGILGFALGYGMRAAQERVSSPPSTV
jgi:hypothetical protein